ncbi:MAG: hypothetical protein NUV69_03065 [Candidatus Curtissbacteria bacterium]|nr:hypothetical protein [Candidatus Curtissbacteria bacterium]
MKYVTQTDLWRYYEVPKMRAKSGDADTKVRLLGRFKQVYPISLFPGEIVVEPGRVVWIKRNGPWQDEIITIMASDIATVYASSGLFFGRVHIKSTTGGPEIFLDKIARRDAYEVRNLVEGIALGYRDNPRVDYQNVTAGRQQLLEAV